MLKKEVHPFSWSFEIRLGISHSCFYCCSSKGKWKSRPILSIAWIFLVHILKLWDSLWSVSSSFFYISKPCLWANSSSLVLVINNMVAVLCLYSYIVTESTQISWFEDACGPRCFLSLNILASFLMLGTSVLMYQNLFWLLSSAMKLVN